MDAYQAGALTPIIWFNPAEPGDLLFALQVWKLRPRKVVSCHTAGRWKNTIGTLAFYAKVKYSFCHNKRPAMM